jgi:hypothetical protein
MPLNQLESDLKELIAIHKEPRLRELLDEVKRAQTYWLNDTVKRSVCDNFRKEIDQILTEL